MLRLAVDTSTKLCSVSLSKNSEIFERSEFAPHSHEELVADMASAVFLTAKEEFRDVEELIVGLGPGSFTGIRIALSFLEGIRLALGVKLVGYNSLQALAASVIGQTEYAVALADARREEVFYALYNLESLEQLIEPQIVAGSSLEKIISEHESRLNISPGSSKIVVAKGDENCIDQYLSRSKIIAQKPSKGLLELRNKGILAYEQGVEFSPIYIRSVAAKTIKERAANKLTKVSLSTID